MAKNKSFPSHLITQDEINNIIGRKVFDIISGGRFAPFNNGADFPYLDSGFVATRWDITKKPQDFGSLLRIGLIDAKDQGNPAGAEIKYVFMMDLDG